MEIKLSTPWTIGKDFITELNDYNPITMERNS